MYVSKQAGRHLCGESRGSALAHAHEAGKALRRSRDSYGSAVGTPNQARLDDPFYMGARSIDEFP